MKIETLLELIDTQVQDKSYRGQFKNPESQTRSSRELGAGSFAKTREHPSDPHMVTKQHHGPHEASRDGFVHWAAYLIHNKLFDNPHFPRLYNVKRFKDANGKEMYKYDVEKLESIEDGRIGKEALLSIIDQNLDLPDDERPSYDHYSADELSRLLAAHIDSAIHGYEREIIKSDSLRDAISKIEEYRKQNPKTIVDLHDGNIMVRRGKYGLTLVITDPFV